MPNGICGRCRILLERVEKKEKDIGVMQACLDHATKEIWSKNPGFSDMMSLAQKSSEIDSQIEAATKRKEEVKTSIKIEQLEIQLSSNPITPR